MPSIETVAIQRFMDTVKRAAQARSRDIRIEITDATLLATEIAVIMSRLAMLENATAETVARAAPPAMDGGTLR